MLLAFRDQRLGFGQDGSGPCKALGSRSASGVQHGKGLLREFGDLSVEGCGGHLGRMAETAIGGESARKTRMTVWVKLVQFNERGLASVPY